jgi:hypothetical protein
MHLDSSTPTIDKAPAMTSNDNEIDEVELARLGIRRVEGNVYQRGDYLYSNIRDALAAARRQPK